VFAFWIQSFGVWLYFELCIVSQLTLPSLPFVRFGVVSWNESLSFERDPQNLTKDEAQNSSCLFFFHS